MTSEQTIIKSLYKTVGLNKNPAVFHITTVKQALEDIYTNSFTTLPVFDFPINVDLSNSSVLINFLNFSVYGQDGRLTRGNKKSVVNNHTLNTLDTFPDTICVFTEANLSKGNNVFIGMRSSHPILKKYVNPEIHGGIVMSSIIPNDIENEGKTSVFQLISFKLFNSKLEENLCDID